MSARSTGAIVDGGQSMRIRSPRLARARRSVVFLVALFAFVWLNFVAETHRHQVASAAAAAGIAAQGGSHATLNRPRPGQPADCPICNEIAHSGAYLPPTVIAFIAAAPAAIWVAPNRPTITAVRTRSHAWLSRAPPLLLHA